MDIVDPERVGVQQFFRAQKAGVCLHSVLSTVSLFLPGSWMLPTSRVDVILGDWSLAAGQTAGLRGYYQLFSESPIALVHCVS